MADSPGTEIDLVRLRDLLLKQTTSEELRSICFDLGVNHEEIISASDKLQMAVINVITHFNRRGRIADLTARLQVVYPIEAWSDVFVTSKTLTGLLTATGSLTVTHQSDTLTAHATVTRRPGPLRVFLCHASDDKPAIRRLYDKLKKGNFAPWLDEEELLPGQKWRFEIQKAIQETDVILVCLSKRSTQKDGYIKKEIEFALDISEKLHNSEIFVIPIRLEECDVPERLSDWHWVDYFSEYGYGRLMKALGVRSMSLGISSIELDKTDPPEEIATLPSEVGNKSQITSSFERFNISSEELASDAFVVAQSYQCNIIDVEHIFLALLEQPRDYVPVILKLLHIDVDTLIKELRRYLKTYSGSVPDPSPAHIFITPRVKRLLDNANAAAMLLGDSLIGVEHFLLAFSTERSGFTSTLIQRFGLNHNMILSLVKKIRQG